ncbi:MAG: DNA polymerase I [candidate division WS2 bacterium ADurb.Bin280]|uniref:DNA polymerase I n=1 Tax=candidate division WS2 bacterium ADurb.Bin280 TaxID=1852829 RepID=A0A1V5SDV7_9BACT|nr:MAG: DNA polymerase I [candidate division WS2 bacterium ADurb.Bin280]
MLLVLIDGNAVLHRSYHATPRFEVEGRLVNAIYGFISTLFSTIEKFKPTHLAVAFDVKGPTFRDEIFKQYKAKRIKPPQEFYDQIPDVWEFVDKMSIPLLSKEGYEADDLIGTIVKKVNGDFKEGEIIIVTGDQDALQLVDQRTKVAMSAMGKIKEMVYDETAVLGKFGFPPETIIDYKALSGDSSDNIPGVAGIGEITAKALLKNYGSLKGIYEALEDKQSFEEKFKNSVYQKLLNGKQDAFMSYLLATIKTDVELDFPIARAKTHDFDRAKVIDFLQKYRFKSLIKRLPQSDRGITTQESLF